MAQGGHGASMPPSRDRSGAVYGCGARGRASIWAVQVDTARGTAAAPAPGVWFGGAALVGALVAVAAGVYGQVHDPASETTIRWFFTTTLHFKAWMTTVARAAGDPASCSADCGCSASCRSDTAPLWVGPAHRIAGSLALLVSLPVAYHCLWSLGLQP